MSIVIVGGNERMECKYKDICKKHGCKAKVFTKMRGNFCTQIGCPDLIVLFVNTVFHKMVGCAVQAANKSRLKIAKCHSSSSCALDDLLKRHVAAGS